MTDELAWLDATAQAALVRQGTATPLELVDAAVARIEKLNPRLNAVITPMFEKARAQAASADLPNGPFRGVPFLLKDLLCHSAGDPYHAGMRFLRELGWVEPHDTFLATKFRQAGFVILGKTNTPELGTAPTTEPVAYGPTRNPWDTHRSPGGSSGGSAVAVASGMVPAAHGNDSGGSIRVPASACGLVGLKPSRGRVSLGPDVAEVQGAMAAELVVTRSVRDTAAILDAVAGWMLGDPYAAPTPPRPFASEVGTPPGCLRIGLMTKTPANAVQTHSDCIAAAHGAARLLESLGHRVEESHPKALDDPGLAAAWATVGSSWFARDLTYWSERTGRAIGQADVEPLTWAMAEIGRLWSAHDYVRALEWLHAYSRGVAQWWSEGFDLLLTPTVAEPPPALGEFAASPNEPLQSAARQTPFITFTSPFNITGQPAISLPLSWNAADLPVGIQLVAAYGREDLLIRIAAQLEQARPWSDRRPPVRSRVENGDKRLLRHR
jgi:amidase